MYFDLTDEQQAIKSTARDFLAARYKSERIRELAESEHGFEQADWDEMAELGWPGLALPEEWGGQGLGVVDLAVLFEEMGYALAPSPLHLDSSDWVERSVTPRRGTSFRQRLRRRPEHETRRATFPVVPCVSAFRGSRSGQSEGPEGIW